MVSVILGLIAIICGGAQYPVNAHSHTLALVIGATGIVFAILGFVTSPQAAASDKDRANNKEGMWLSIAGGILSLVVGIIVLFAK